MRPGDYPEGIVDSTGLETHHISRYFRWKKESTQPDRQIRAWPKVTLVCHRQTHWLLGLYVCQGPTQDAHLLRRVMPDVHRMIHLYRLMADAGYDSEKNHIFCREKLGIPRTVIPARANAFNRKWPQSKYRRQMRRRFHKIVYRQRVQIECVMFRFKSHLGDALRARRWPAQVRECRLRALCFNFALLAA